ncbi:MAG TPA: hypothetical protein VIV07_02910 [Sphingomicrobium sp.]
MPRWVVPFLRALERTGEARTAAEDAGIDHTTAYQQRRMHPDFALAWEQALEAHAAAKKRAEADRPLSLPSLRNGCPSPADGGGADGEELIASGNQLKRASGERWGKKKEQAFLAELAATGNLKRSCKAVGISYEAVHKRRRKDARLDAACTAAIEACRARIPEFLASAAAATFDPDALPEPEANPLPKVSISEAIKIGQMKVSAQARESSISTSGMMSWQEEADSLSEDEIWEVRERLINRLRRMREWQMPRQLAAGWSYDESYDEMIPPGWVKGPNYRPRDPDLPEDFYYGGMLWDD